MRLINPNIDDKRLGDLSGYLRFAVTVAALIALNPPGMLVEIVIKLSYPGMLLLLAPLACRFFGGGQPVKVVSLRSLPGL